MLLRMTVESTRGKAFRHASFNEAGAMLLRMTMRPARRPGERRRLQRWAGAMSASMRPEQCCSSGMTLQSLLCFNEAGAMLLRMTRPLGHRDCGGRKASMRPEQCCSG